jgi:hypothetical protein
VPLPAPRAYTLQVRAQLFGEPGVATTHGWTYVRCSATQFTRFAADDSVECVECPTGGDCSPRGGVDDVVQLQHVVAQQGWWASPHSDGRRFYRCPVAAACLPGVNGTRSQCERGYGGVACSVCITGYFEQFGQCVSCSSSSRSAIGIVAGFLLVGVAVLFLLYQLRKILPVDIIKLGVSLMQILASANSAYRCVRCRVVLPLVVGVQRAVTWCRMYARPSRRRACC